MVVMADWGLIHVPGKSSFVGFSTPSDSLEEYLLCLPVSLSAQISVTGVSLTPA